MIRHKKNKLFWNNRLCPSLTCILSVFVLFSIFTNECLSNVIENPNENQRIESVSLPKLELDKRSYDFGVIKPNSKNKAVFNLTNVGNKPLIIKDVKKCCGAVIQLDKEELISGESGVLTVEYRNGTGTGTFNKTVSLTTNLTARRQLSGKNVST